MRVFKWFKQKIARRIRRIAQADETQNRLKKLEDSIRQLHQKAVDRDTVSEFVFLSELRSKAHTDDAVTRLTGGHRPEQTDFLTPEMYSAFEDRFRGSVEIIRKRLRLYVPIVADSAGGRRVVDIGCGRGEWLEIARDAGFAIQGVEISPVAVEICRSKGFDVVHLDAQSYLDIVEPGSLGAVTLFHVIEHLSLNELFRVLCTARTALAPGGLFLAEIPNIASLAVGASNFWIDPTHLRPLHPELVQFISQQAGFERVEIHHPDLMNKQGNATVADDDWRQRIDACPDVAVMAWA